MHEVLLVSWNSGFQKLLCSSNKLNFVQLHFMQQQAARGYVSIVVMIYLLLPKCSAGFLLPDEQS